VADGAEDHFLKAIDIARKQQAKSFELRAVMSLVRLRQQQALQAESRNTQHATRALLADAHRMLSELYAWFTEGFDSKDVQDAKALLHTLEQQTSTETVPSTRTEPETPPPTLRLVVNKRGRR
jgi:adenylate cyclase